MADNKEMIYLSEVIWGLEIAKQNGWYGFVDFKVPGNNQIETVVYHPSDIGAKIEYFEQAYNNDGTCKTSDKRMVNSGAICKFERYKRCILNTIAPAE